MNKASTVKLNECPIINSSSDRVLHSDTTRKTKLADKMVRHERRLLQQSYEDKRLIAQ